MCRGENKHFSGLCINLKETRMHEPAQQGHDHNMRVICGQLVR
jgi:hypothetical protein